MEQALLSGMMHGMAMTQWQIDFQSSIAIAHCRMQEMTVR